MKNLILGFTFLIAASVAHAEAGFKNGNDIDVTFYSGWVKVRCSNGEFDQSYFCRAGDYNPGTHDRFVTDKRINAERVALTAFHEDGSKKTKKVRFDKNKGLSKKVNLLTSTLLQRPLLELGLNLISYELTKNRRVMASGEFKSMVTVVGDLNCPSMIINSWGTTCESQGSACNTYFNRVRNCK